VIHKTTHPEELLVDNELLKFHHADNTTDFSSVTWKGQSYNRIKPRSITYNAMQPDQSNQSTQAAPCV